MIKKLSEVQKETQLLIEEVDNRKIGKILSAIFIFLIIFYPIIESYLGIDIGDTGIHYTNFKYIYSKQDIVGYSTVFTSIVGNWWLNLFNGWGLYSLNLLEVIIEWLLAFISYQWAKKFYGRTITLAGILIAIISVRAYINVFNYHQFSVFLIVLLLYLVYYAIFDNKGIYSFVAGGIYVLAVFARVSSVALISIFLMYIIYGIEKKLNVKFYLKHLFNVFAGMGLLCSLIYFYMKYMNIWDAFVNSIFKVKEMGENTSNVYSFSNLIQMFIVDNIKTLASPIILISAIVLFMYACYLFTKKTCISILWAAVLVLCSVILGWFSYNVNPVNGSPQFTTGPNFMFGFFLLACILYSIINISCEEKCMMAIFSMLIPLYTVMGSNTGTKHILISMWLIAPLLIYVICLIFAFVNNYCECVWKKRIRIAGIILIVSVFIKYSHMIIYTNNFEAINRFRITETVNSDNVKCMRTTKEEAKALNGLIAASSGNKDRKLIVFGTGAGLFAILDREPATRVFLVDSNTTASYLASLLNAITENADVVFCRTNQYFGYAERDYEKLKNAVLSNTYKGKKNVLYKYLKRNNYSLEYENDFYLYFTKGGSDKKGNYKYYEKMFAK